MVTRTLTLGPLRGTVEIDDVDRLEAMVIAYVRDVVAGRAAHVFRARGIADAGGDAARDIANNAAQVVVADMELAIGGDDE